MNYLTHQLLNSEELEILRENLEKEELFWEDGKKTAGKHASEVKNNLQLRRDSDLSKKFSTLITKKILSNELIKSFSLPKMVHGTMFSKSTSGMKYGRHLDNPYMSSGRADLSFTPTSSDIDKDSDLLDDGEINEKIKEFKKKIKNNYEIVSVNSSKDIQKIKKLLIRYAN